MAYPPTTTIRSWYQTASPRDAASGATNRTVTIASAYSKREEAEGLKQRDQATEVAQLAHRTSHIAFVLLLSGFGSLAALVTTMVPVNSPGTDVVALPSIVAWVEEGSSPMSQTTCSPESEHG